MAIEVDTGLIRLSGNCDHTDVEPLLEALQAHPGAPIDLTAASHLHGTVLQVLLTCRPVALEGAPRDTFIQQWLVPAIAQGTKHLQRR